jgi:hypothetical protein
MRSPRGIAIRLHELPAGKVQRVSERERRAIQEHGRAVWALHEDATAQPTLTRVDLQPLREDREREKTLGRDEPTPAAGVAHR